MLSQNSILFSLPYKWGTLLCWETRTCSCCCPHHKGLFELFGGTLIRLFCIRALCVLACLLLPTWGQTSGAPRAPSQVNSQDRSTAESKWRVCPKLLNPIPQYCVQSDHIFHLANKPCPPESVIGVFVSSSLIYLKSVLRPSCYNSQNIPLISIPNSCMFSFHTYVTMSIAQINLFSSLWIYRLIYTIVPLGPPEIKAMPQTTNISQDLNIQNIVSRQTLCQGFGADKIKSSVCPSWAGQKAL